MHSEVNSILHHCNPGCHDTKILRDVLTSIIMVKHESSQFKLHCLDISGIEVRHVTAINHRL